MNGLLAARLSARGPFLAVLLGLFWTAPASSTYSIAGTDSRTRQVGGAGTSCLSGSDVYIIFAPVPGVGVVHAQARYLRSERDRGAALLAQGLAPASVVQSLADAVGASERQFGVVDLSGNTAAFTGPDAGVHASHATGRRGDLAYVVAGNILTGQNVISQARAGFERPACDLAERLMNALEAGAEKGEGDRRCTETRGIPSDSAFLQVDRPDEPSGSYLSLRVPTSGDENPLVPLRKSFAAWRAQNPCAPAPMPQLPPAEDQSSGCSCELSSRGAPTQSVVTFAGIALLSCIRRRRRRAHAAPCADAAPAVECH